MSELFRKFARKISEVLGRAEVFLGAVVLIVIWAVLGPIYHYSDTWQLVINTATTIVTFLMAVGLVHGLAGSAAVALLVLSTVKSPYAATAYLLLFGLGTITGMTVITALLSLPFRVPLLIVNRGLAIGTGVGSFVFGLCLIVQIGFVDGLFLRF